ncbi:MAG: hypothetical protein V4753_05095 [Pseudomonadota bacterium]
MTATGLRDRAATDLLQGVKFRQDGRRRRYALADLLPVLPSRYAFAAGPLVAAAKPDPTDTCGFVGGDETLPAAKRFEAWLQTNVEGSEERLHKLRVTFAEALSRAVRSSNLSADHERLRLMILRTDFALPFLVTGKTSSL